MSLSRRSLLKWLGVGVGTLALPIPHSPVLEPARGLPMASGGMDPEVVKLWERALEREIQAKDPLFDNPIFTDKIGVYSDVIFIYE